MLNSNVNLWLIADSSSNDIEQQKQLSEKGMKVIILDHHEISDSEKIDNVIIVNNQIVKNESSVYAGVGVVAQWIRALGYPIDKYVDLVAVGLIADAMTTVSLANRYYINEGLDNLKIKRNILQSKYDTEISNLLIDKILIELCEKAKSNFDKKQPNLQKAQEFLSIMTDGKYTKINLDNELIQNDSGTIIKKWNNLSRGTKELLFFALKLGFAVNYSKDKMTLEPNGNLDLPLIIDDALVNFDATRTKNAIKCLQEFSKTNQVLFFTCHSEVMKKYFEELCDDFNIVNLEN